MNPTLHTTLLEYVAICAVVAVGFAGAAVVFTLKAVDASLSVSVNRNRPAPPPDDDDDPDDDGEFPDDDPDPLGPGAPDPGAAADVHATPRRALDTAELQLLEHLDRSTWPTVPVGSTRRGRHRLGSGRVPWQQPVREGS